jgi:hypothetical protein
LTTNAAATERSSRLPDGSEAACEGDTRRHIDGQCGPSMARTLRRARIANEAPAIAALPLGRSAVTAPAPSAEPLDATGVDIAVAAPAAAFPGPPVPALKSAKRSSRGRSNNHDSWGIWSWRDDRWAARAYAFDNRYLHGRYQRSWSWSR